MPLDSASEITQISAVLNQEDISCGIADAEVKFYAKNVDAEELQLLTIKNALEYEKLENEKQNREDRKKYANRIYWLMVSWISAIMIIIIAQGFGENINFEVSDKVLITLIGGTTINILGVFVIVAKYLFNHANNLKKDKKLKPKSNKKPKKPKD